MVGVCEGECMGRTLEGIKGEISVILLFLKLCFSFTLGHFMA